MSTLKTNLPSRVSRLERRTSELQQQDTLMQQALRAQAIEHQKSMEALGRRVS